MPSWEALAAFAVASVVIIAIPGPSVLFVIGRSLSCGRRAGLSSVLGNELGALPLVAAVALGVGTVVAQSILLFTMIKLAGAAYLVYLGVQAIRGRADREAITAGEGSASSSWDCLRQGFVVGVTNPKTIVFFVAVLPQFVDVHAGAVATQMMVLGVLFTLIALACDSVWALAAGTARVWFATSGRRLAALRAAGGTMMIGLAGVLAVTSNRAA
ncbi:LysE family translocator [Mycolicibacterium sp. 018/SC-01/001]|uniref:LysE family translocator n=1 Tax=Mycolicibacterium sp. 018/SC-01/001 TaxID=2592069 RepID=UPI001180E9E3|nr:LysE family translocator [Mycolicibacterium sp. 018/SC-01/001]TRW82372.1 LysE family translocator [Mycolicibacterium sp. 018/SC-01/001]